MSLWMLLLAQAPIANGQRQALDMVVWMGGSLAALLLGGWLLKSGASRGRQIAGCLATLVGAGICVALMPQLERAQALAWGLIFLASATFTGLQYLEARRWWAIVVGGLAVMLLLVSLSIPLGWRVVIFWGLAGVILVAAVATVSSRNPIYSAIWFALTLLGVGAWMLVQGAQFLGIATVAVYAGAIVVTFLFVLMLAQPQGHAYYDHVSWGRLPVAIAAGAGALLVGLVVLSVGPWTDAAEGMDTRWVQAVEQIVQQHAPAGQSPHQISSVRLQQGIDRAWLTVTLAPESQQPLTAQQQTDLQAEIERRLVELQPVTFAEDRPWQVRVTDSAIDAPAHMALLGREQNSHRP